MQYHLKPPDIVLSPSFMLFSPWLAPQGALSYEFIISFHPGGGAPGAGKQGEGTRRHGLGTLQKRDLRDRRAKTWRDMPLIAFSQNENTQFLHSSICVLVPPTREVSRGAKDRHKKRGHRVRGIKQNETPLLQRCHFKPDARHDCTCHIFTFNSTYSGGLMCNTPSGRGGCQIKTFAEDTPVCILCLQLL